MPLCSLHCVTERAPHHRMSPTNQPEQRHQPWSAVNQEHSKALHNDGVANGVNAQSNGKLVHCSWSEFVFVAVVVLPFQLLCNYLCFFLVVLILVCNSCNLILMANIKISSLLLLLLLLVSWLGSDDAQKPWHSNSIYNSVSIVL